MASDSSAAPTEKTLFGHPRGLTYLFTTEMAERFSYYGMTAFLILYLTKYLLLPGHHDSVIGYDAVRNALEALIGPLSVERYASLVFGLYTGLVYLTPVLGGFLADRVFGQRYSVVAGGIIMAAGEFMLTQDSLFFFGLLALIVGNGAFKPNISTQVGNLLQSRRFTNRSCVFDFLRRNQYRCDSGAAHMRYSGAGGRLALGILCCLCGVGVSLGVLVYLFALRTLPPDRVTKARRAGTNVERKNLSADDWKAILALVALCLPVALFWMAYQQQSITINLWAADYTDRTFVIPGLVRFDMPASWSQFINPAMIFAFTPLVVGLWAWQARRGREPSTVLKMATGCALQAISYVIMAGVAFITGAHGHASWLWLLLFFTAFTLGELYLSPIGLALVARVAPQQVLSLMMGFWFISVFIGNIFAGYIGGFWDTMSKPQFFLASAGIGAVASVIIFLFNRPLKPIIEGRMSRPLTPGRDLATEEVVPAE